MRGREKTRWPSDILPVSLPLGHVCQCTAVSCCKRALPGCQSREIFLAALLHPELCGNLGVLSALGA